MTDAPTQEIALADGSTLDVTLHPAPAPDAGLIPAAALDQWLDRHVRNSAYSRDTICWNAIAAAIGTIKAALAAVDSKGE
jgi:hypothetical protein